MIGDYKRPLRTKSTDFVLALSDPKASHLIGANNIKFAYTYPQYRYHYGGREGSGHRGKGRRKNQRGQTRPMRRIKWKKRQERRLKLEAPKTQSLLSPLSS